MSEILHFDAVAAAGGTVTLMHRLTDSAGVALLREDVVSITYTVSAIGADGTLEAVTGHDGLALTVADVIFDTMQTGPPWDAAADAEGYNFRHTPDISENDAFPEWDCRYLIAYKVVPLVGPPIVWRWIVRTPATV